MPSLLRSSRRLQSLRRAMANLDYVRVTRSIDGTDPVAGYLVGVGAHWVLLSVVEASLSNGWVALAVADIDSMEVAPEGRFVRRGLESRHEWPPRPMDPPWELSNHVRGLLDSAHERHSLAALFTERHGRADFTLGRPVRWTEEGLEWQELGRDASWADEVQLCDPSAITRVDAGGRYALALARVADLRLAI